MSCLLSFGQIAICVNSKRTQSQHHILFSSPHYLNLDLQIYSLICSIRNIFCWRQRPLSFLQQCSLHPWHCLGHRLQILVCFCIFFFAIKSHVAAYVTKDDLKLMILLPPMLQVLGLWVHTSNFFWMINNCRETRNVILSLHNILLIRYKYSIASILIWVSKRQLRKDSMANKQVSNTFKDMAYLSVSHHVSGSLSHSRPLWKFSFEH